MYLLSLWSLVLEILDEVVDGLKMYVFDGHQIALVPIAVLQAKPFSFT